MVEVFTPGKLYTPHRVPLTAYGIQGHTGTTHTIRPGTPCFLVSIGQDMPEYIRAQFGINYCPDQLAIPHFFLLGEQTVRAWIEPSRRHDWDEYDENWSHLVL